MPEIIVNQQLFYKVGKNMEIISESDKPKDYDIIHISKNRYHIIMEGKGYTAEVRPLNERSDKLEIEINGKIYSVKFKSDLDLLTEKLGMQTTSDQTEEKEVLSPMPGMIVQIQAKEGDEVKEGSPLLVLKAMKMENIIKSPRSGKITKILAKEGSSVEKNQPLIEF
ncbi:MAG: acetyl-CoA carboxylase biotin carboxyl carrier protein subunit [Cyclobacteriaceae bacterium]|nr:acetyl-CoA carboxylase biotin carboxyl carrier protein subunit [Cyclobacteriaceae bacterium]